MEEGLGDEASEIIEGSHESTLRTGMVTSLFSFHDDLAPSHILGSECD